MQVMRDLCPRQVCREKSKDAQFTGGELTWAGEQLLVRARRRRASQLVDDVGEKGTMGCLVVTEHAEYLRG
ncbi:hypothetical protein, partial [Amycolatopsis acidiphila]|uniref:hypothetical protein n=1 Tax=Amycolatopsis acidiphila TaxID=715473 RepID=UPI001F1C7681